MGLSARSVEGVAATGSTDGVSMSAGSVTVKARSQQGRDRINLSVLVFSNGIAAFTFFAVHTAIPLEIFVFKKI